MYRVAHCNTIVFQLLTHWSYISLSVIHRYERKLTGFVASVSLELIGEATGESHLQTRNGGLAGLNVHVVNCAAIAEYNIT